MTVQLNCVTVMCHCKSGRAVSKRDQQVTCFALLPCTARLPCSARPAKRIATVAAFGSCGRQFVSVDPIREPDSALTPAL